MLEMALHIVVGRMSLCQAWRCVCRSPGRRQSPLLVPFVCQQLSSGCRPQRPSGGARPLTDPQIVFDHNNWDNVVWDESQESEARRITEEQAADLVSFEKQVEYEEKAYEFWDSFYKTHQDKFFKDRHWLFTEFPELAPYAHSTTLTQLSNSHSGSEDEVEEEEEDSDELLDEEEKNVDDDSTSNAGIPEIAVIPPTSPLENHDPDESFHIFEVGCGAGNTVFPVLKTNTNPNLMMYCCDFSNKAIELVKEHPDFEPSRCHPFVCDITNENSPVPFEENSLDIIIMIFVLNAISPHRMQQTVDRLSNYLKPGGLLLFRDYGRYDMAQLRFKKGRCLSENFYVRQDGTRVYFFTQDELRQMFIQAGLKEEQNIIDRRLQVNRSRQLKMYRVWIQCKYRKPLQDS